MEGTGKETLRLNVLSLVLYLICAGALYYSTVNAPFYFDDYPQILENSLLKNVPDIWNSRGFSMWTFFLNLKFFGTSLPAFHVVNILLHVGCSYLVFLLLKQLLPSEGLLCFLGGILFLSHPLQTQAVNYIVQRMTLLAAFFSLATCYFYLRFRRSQLCETQWVSLRAFFFYLSAFVASFLALQSKQNAAVLPLLLILIECSLGGDRGRKWRQVLWLVPFFVWPLVSGIREFLEPLILGGGGSAVAHAEFLQSKEFISPLRYFITEWSVLLVYIRLLFLPFWQMFDYGYPFVESIFTLKNIFAGTAIVVILAYAISQFRRNILVSVSILWFFVALSVESTFIPLDPLFEHRLYLPMFGFCLLILVLWKRFSLSCNLLLILIVFLGISSGLRNQVWATPETLWAADIEHGSKSYRSHLAYADALYEKGDLVEARQAYIEGARLFQDSKNVDQDNPKFMYNLGVSFERLKKYGLAENYYRKALLEDPGYARAVYGLGVVLYRQEAFAGSADAFQMYVRIKPYDPTGLASLGDVLVRLGRREEAVKVADKLKVLSPEKYVELMRLIRE